MDTYFTDLAFIAKFEARLDKTTVPGCHLWTGSLNDGGYGQVRVGAKMRKAHAVALEIALGRRLDLGTGARNRLNANHRDDLCSRKDCCNAEHLYEGTQAANMEDARRCGKGGAAAMARKTHCPRGHEYDMVNSTNGGRACRRCHADAMERTVARRLAGELIPGRGRPKNPPCVHGDEFTVRQSNGVMECVKCRSERRKVRKQLAPAP